MHVMATNLNAAAFASAQHRSDVILAATEDRSLSIILRATKITRRGGSAFPLRVAVGYARFARNLIPVFENLTLPLSDANIGHFVNTSVEAANRVTALRST